VGEDGVIGRPGRTDNGGDPQSGGSEPEVEAQCTGFDFILGSWTVRNRRLTERLQASNMWEEFVTVSTARRLWDGVGNVDEIVGESPSGPVKGVTIRLFDSGTDEWRLYWATPKSGILEPPMIGRFDGRRGVFYNHELFNGRGIFVRFIYSDITPRSCRWQQAFSNDGGSTWEVNWYMDFTRLG